MANEEVQISQSIIPFVYIAVLQHQLIQKFKQLNNDLLHVQCWTHAIWSFAIKIF